MFNIQSILDTISLPWSVCQEVMEVCGSPTSPSDDTGVLTGWVRFSALQQVCNLCPTDIINIVKTILEIEPL